MNWTHRDLLGGLLGDSAEALGDILIETEGPSFVREEIAPFLTEQTERIGRAGVRLFAGERRNRFRLRIVLRRFRRHCVAAAGLYCGSFCRFKPRKKAAAAVGAGLRSDYREETSLPYKWRRAQSFLFAVRGNWYCRPTGAEYQEGAPLHCRQKIRLKSRSGGKKQGKGTIAGCFR